MADKIETAFVTTRNPVVREEKVKFARLVGIDDFINDEYMVVRFERDIAWVRETTTQMEVFIDDESITEYTPWNDYYGFMTSVQDPLESVHEYSVSRKLTPESSRDARVTMTIVDVPYLVPPEHIRARRARYNGTTFLHIPNGWYLDDEVVERRAALWSEPHPRSDDHIERNFAPENELHKLEEIPVATVVVYSSKRSAEENHAALLSLTAFVPEGMTATLEGLALYATPTKTAEGA